MVNMIGFHPKEPEYNTAGPGEDGYYCHVTPMPTLADMTPEQRAECVGMWCDNLVSTADNPKPVVLACVQGEYCWILHTDLHGEWSCFSLGSVAPRFDLPRAWNADGTPLQVGAEP